MRFGAKRPLAAGTYLVTGAASGFGREFVRQLVARRAPVALWDRDINGLDTTCAIAGCPQAHREVVDVTDHAQVQEAAARTRATVGSIAHVIHCAGILHVGPALSVPANEYRAMLEVNALGSIHVALATLPFLREVGQRDARSTLMLVSSVAGLRGFPELAGYCASKHAVLGFAQSLRDELADEPVDIKVLCPPPGDTPMVQKLAKRPPVYKLSRLYSAEEIVTSALDGFETRAWIELVDLGSKALWRAARLAPVVVDQIVQYARKA
jgi:NAD(P)-dependent dehydrogenase (short-subunit alcohol dehydrogenase family)